MALLSVENLKTYFHTRNGVVRAVDGISYSVEAGETLGIVGESGSGKSVSCYSLLGLIPTPPGRIESGTALFEGRDLLHCPERDLRKIRGQRIAMIFQDPMTALNPYMTIGAQLMETVLVHEKTGRQEARKRALVALEEVGLQDGEDSLGRFPHEYSGGMRQRVLIAMALITRPQLLIADEPTTALDVTVQAQILDLIKRMQEERGMAVILITHDLGVIASICDRVLVMYAGRIVESSPVDALFAKPGHPYTRALMESLPSTQRSRGELYAIPGMPPDLSNPIEGCAFVPRCAHAEDRCSKGELALAELTEGHATACIRVQRGEL